MSAIDDILADIPIDQLASQLGVDEATAEAATRQAIPALLGGMQANAQDPGGAASLAGALGNHSSALVDGGVDLNQVDIDDGRKIVHNVFGSNTDQVAQTLGSNVGGGQSDLIQKLLPLLAPIVMSYLAKATGWARRLRAAAACSARSWAGMLGGGNRTGPPTPIVPASPSPTSWAVYSAAAAASRSVEMQETRQRSLASAVSRAVQPVNPPSPISMLAVPACGA